MSDPSLDPASGVRMIGGELQEWSDVVAPQSVLAAVVAPLLDDRPPASVLLLGPGAQDLAVRLGRSLPEGAEGAGGSEASEGAEGAEASGLTLLVRGRTQAVQWQGSGRAAGGPAGRVWCGAADRLPEDARFDLVVATGPAAVLLSPDSQQLDPVSLVALLARHLTERGRLVAVLPGTVDVAALGSRAPLADADADWPVLSAAVTTAPAHHHLGAALGAALDPHGLEHRVDWAAHPDPRDLRVLGHADCWTQPDTRALLADVVAGVSREPDLLAPLVRAGLGDDLAPARVVVASPDPLPPLPDLVVDDRASGAPRVVVLPAPAPPGAPVPVDGVPGLTRATSVQVRPGLPLAQVLAGAATHGDRVRVRTLLQAYADQLASLAEHEPGALVGFLPTNVAVGQGDSLDLIDGSWVSDPAVPAEAVLAAALDVLAAGLPVGPPPQVWSLGSTTADRRVDLASMLGQDPTEPSVPTPSSPALTHLVDVLARSSRGARATDARDPGTAGLEATVKELTARVRWLEGTLRARDRQVAQLERAVDVEASTAYRLVVQAGRPLPALKRRARLTLDRLRER